MFKSKSLPFLFVLEALAISSYAWHQFIAVFLGQKNIRIFPAIILLPVFVFFIAFILSKLIRRITGSLSRITGLSESRLSRSFLIAFSPSLLLFLVFLQYVVFLRDISGYLLPLSLFGSAYLIVLILYRLKRVYPLAITLPESVSILNPNRFPPKRLPLLVFLSGLAVYILLASGLVFPPQPFTGDEPHYLLITKSILKDGDINLFNNYEDKDYLEYYPGDLRSHAYSGKKGEDHQYSRHSPAVSLLVLPTFYLGEKAIQINRALIENPENKRRIIVFFSRLPLCILTALVGLVFFLIARDFTQRQDLAIIGWAVFGFTVPVLFYSHLIYPEIPVALIVMLIFRYLLLKKESGSLAVFLSGMGIALLPWFGVKYIILSAIVFLVSLFAFRGSNIEIKWKKLLLLATPSIVSAGMYLLFLWNCYGSISPSSVYRGAPLNSSTPAGFSQFLKSDFIEFFRRIIGYFFDQRFGIFIYAPVYALAIAGLIYFWKQKKKETWRLVFIFFGYTLFSAYYYWGGYCPPGRPMIPVLWIFALFIVFSFTASQNTARSLIKRFSITLSLLVVWMALKNPWILYHEIGPFDFIKDAPGSNLLIGLSNTFIDFGKLFPLLGRESTNWIPLAVWMIAFAFTIIFFMKKPGKKKPEPTYSHMAGHLSLVFCLALFVLAYTFFDIQLDRRNAFEGPSYEVFFQDANHYEDELGGFWTKGARKAAIVLKTPSPISRMELSLTGRAEGRTEIQAGRTKMTVERTQEKGFSRTASFSPKRGFPLRRGYLYYIAIEDSSGFVPFKLDRKEQDNRYLGVFVKITAHLRDP